MKGMNTDEHRCFCQFVLMFAVAMNFDRKL